MSSVGVAATRSVKPSFLLVKSRSKTPDAGKNNIITGSMPARDEPVGNPLHATSSKNGSTGSPPLVTSGQRYSVAVSRRCVVEFQPRQALSLHR